VSEPLRLRAIDDEDLAVLAACLQDALVPAQDMRYLADEKRFVLVANRFCWERLPATGLGAGGDGAPDAGPFERVHCGLTIEHVRRVQTRGFAEAGAGDSEKLYEVLTILAEPGADSGAVLTLVLAGEAAVRLEVDRIEVIAGDVGEPWPTLWRPDHALGGTP
jgi:hypothetical protein